jgi:hypothetical protein
VFIKSNVVISGAIIFAAACAAQAKGGGPPNIDLQSVCRATDKEIHAVFSDITRNVYDVCMSDEQDAHTQLVKEWASLAAPDKVRCVRTAGYLPSYVEWITCLDMARDVRTMHKEQAVSPTVGTSALAQSTQRTGAPNIKGCPIVQWREDGSIASLRAC